MEQMSLFEIDMSFKDTHSDKYGRKRKVPSWMKYERCENCQCWNMYQTEEQPPEGWGEYGWCTKHKEKCISSSYCQEWEDKNRL